MTLAILQSARDDLADGFDFYEKPQAGLRAYFLELFFSDTDSLQIYAGVHAMAFGFRFAREVSAQGIVMTPFL
jgi:hypothetical protein